MSQGPDVNVIALVDDDPALLELLQGLLQAPGRVVDSLPALQGLSPELIALSQPKVVLLNPRAGGLGLEAMAKVVAQVRELVPARFVLMLSEADSHDPVMAEKLGADGSVPVRVLLRDPLKALVPAPVEAEPAMPFRAARSVDDMSADAILSLDFEETPWAPPTIAPEKPRVAAGGRTLEEAGAAAQALASLIDDELGHAIESSNTKPQRFEVLLDTISEHNLLQDFQGKLIGVFVGSAFPPQPKTKVEVSLTFPWNQAFVLSGQVTFVRTDAGFGKRRRSGFGAQVTFDAEAKKAADRFLGLRPAARPPQAA